MNLVFPYGAGCLVTHLWLITVQFIEQGRFPLFVQGAAHRKNRTGPHFRNITDIGGIYQANDLVATGISQRFKCTATNTDWLLFSIVELKCNILSAACHVGIKLAEFT